MELMSALILEFCKMLNVCKLSATSYHSQTLVKRLNKTLKQMLRAYAVVKSLMLAVHLQCILFAFREVPNETTSFTPVELLNARHVRD